VSWSQVSMCCEHNQVELVSDIAKRKTEKNEHLRMNRHLERRWKCNCNKRIFIKTNTIKHTSLERIMVYLDEWEVRKWNDVTVMGGKNSNFLNYFCSEWFFCKSNSKRMMPNNLQ
jgi:hypothetical protein